MSTIWVRFVWLLLAITLFVSLPISLFYGLNWGLAAAIVCLLLLLCWHLLHLHQLMGWLLASLNSPVPRGRGVWEIAFAELHRRVRIRQGQQQSLSETLEHFRRAIQALPDGVIALTGTIASTGSTSARKRTLPSRRPPIEGRP